MADEPIEDEELRDALAALEEQLRELDRLSRDDV